MKTIKGIATYFQQAINLEKNNFYMYEFNVTHLHYCKHNVKSKWEFMIGVNYTNPLHEEIAYAGFGAGIEISDIEDILLPLYAKNFTQHLVNRNVPTRTISFNEFTGISEMWEKLRPYFNVNLIDNKFKVEELAKKVMEQINLYVEPFWQKYSNIQYINDAIINNVSEDDLGNYLPGMGNFKKLIIMKLCKNNKYEEYKNYIQNLVNNALIQDKVQYEPYWNLFNDLVEYLDQNEAVLQIGG